ncbi:hypothetical protein EYF80_058517 [Liparis tanakae]|uniref:Uncharacterized protein n=1 Tax=Liparis tanakae TaxID=230148 RepID=A0A4Z2ERW7_9TELE|nr:hypothetical protein EYF80_058517 [Liparis tanakae]
MGKYSTTSREITPVALSRVEKYTAEKKVGRKVSRRIRGRAAERTLMEDLKIKKEVLKLQPYVVQVFLSGRLWTLSHVERHMSVPVPVCF